MKTFHFNNSSLQYLSCARRYYYQVVKGLLPPPGGNKYTAAGLGFHKMMQLVGTDGWASVALRVMTDETNIPPSIKKLPMPQRLQLAGTADRIFQQHPELFQPNSLREHWFSFTLNEDFGQPLLDGEMCAAAPCGTIDNLSIISDTLVLTDYKTTSKPIDPALTAGYKLTSQRFFYQMAALVMELPKEMAILRDSLKVAWRYCYVQVESGDYYLEEPQLFDEYQLQHFRGLILDKAILAAAIHADPNLAVKEGILTGQCWKCPYSSICLAADEEAAMQSWYYGSQPYNPKHDE